MEVTHTSYTLLTEVNAFVISPQLFLLNQYDYVTILHYLNTYVNNRHLKFIMIIEKKKLEPYLF